MAIDKGSTCYHWVTFQAVFLHNHQSIRLITLRIPVSGKNHQSFMQRNRAIEQAHELPPQHSQSLANTATQKPWHNLSPISISILISISGKKPNANVAIMAPAMNTLDNCPIPNDFGAGFIDTTKEIKALAQFLIYGSICDLFLPNNQKSTPFGPHSETKEPALNSCFLYILSKQLLPALW